MSLSLNGVKVKSATISIPWRGAWVADIDLQGSQDVPVPPPTGPVVLSLNDAAYRATVDPRYSGTFVSNATVRIVGGGGGWDKPVKAQDFYSPAGVLSTVVYNATALSVTEVVADPSPKTFPERFARTAGPAMRIFGDRQWYVDPTTGVTTVADWPPAVFDGVIVNYDPTAGTVTLHSEGLILPGNLLTDSRFNGQTFIVRDVEQVFDASGCTATAWVCADPISRVQAALTAMVRELAETQYLRTYQYRFVLGGEQTLALQAITPGAPDLNPIKQWTGLSGATSKLAPGTVIIVGFAGGDPAYPYLVSFSSLATPLEVDIAGGANYLVPAPWAAALTTALVTFATGLNVGTLTAQATALVTALGILPPAATILTKAT